MRLALLLYILSLGGSLATKDLSKRVVYAINCGGPEHVGEGGIRYKADEPMEDTVDSDFGQRYFFVNAHSQDRALYQTERYSMGSFTYSFPFKEGHFVLILKFSEVYFTYPGGKIFNVNLNGIPIVKNLDIFREAQSVGAAFDKYVEFAISKGLIHVAGQKASIGSAIEIEFAKGLEDNPKVNALAILTGGETGLPPLPAPVQMDEQEMNTRRRREIEDDEDGEDKWQQMEEIRSQPDPDAQINLDVASGARVSNPHDEKNDLLYIVVSALLVLTIPVVYFLKNL